MAGADENKVTLTRFLEEVWNRGDAEASERYVAPFYTIHHDPGDRQRDQDVRGDRPLHAVVRQQLRAVSVGAATPHHRLAQGRPRRV